MRIVATTAALNEARNLPAVLAGVPAGIDIILVDDGSTDATAEIARSHGARVARHPAKLGQGIGLITCFRAALASDYDVLVFFDSDGQHDPQDIPQFLARLDETGADIVVGSRILGSNYAEAPFFRRTMLPVLTWLLNRITGYSLTDPMCGFRAFRVDSLRRLEPVLLRLEEPQYLAAEMFIRFAREGLRVEEVPIHLNPRDSGTSYKGFVRYGWGVARAVLRTVLSTR